MPRADRGRGRECGLPGRRPPRLPTDDYSFAYIATWAGRDDQAVTSTASRVLGAARTLIAVTDPATTPDPAAAAELADAAQAGTTGRRGDLERAADTARGRWPPPWTRTR